MLRISYDGISTAEGTIAARFTLSCGTAPTRPVDVIAKWNRLDASAFPIALDQLLAASPSLISAYLERNFGSDREALGVSHHTIRLTDEQLREEYQAIEGPIGGKECDRKVEVEGQPFCNAPCHAEQNSIHVDGRRVIRTTGALCRLCELPDLRFRCSSLVHASVASNLDVRGLIVGRRLAEVSCDEGHLSDVKPGPGCVPGHNHCWHWYVRLPAEPDGSVPQADQQMHHFSNYVVPISLAVGYTVSVLLISLSYGPFGLSPLSAGVSIAELLPFLVALTVISLGVGLVGGVAMWAIQLAIGESANQSSTLRRYLGLDRSGQQVQPNPPDNSLDRPRPMLPPAAEVMVLLILTSGTIWALDMAIKLHVGRVIIFMLVLIALHVLPTVADFVLLGGYRVRRLTLVLAPVVMMTSITSVIGHVLMEHTGDVSRLSSTELQLSDNRRLSVAQRALGMRFVQINIERSDESMTAISDLCSLLVADRDGFVFLWQGEDRGLATLPSELAVMTPC